MNTSTQRTSIRTAQSLLILLITAGLAWGLHPAKAASSQVLTVPAGAFQPRCSYIQYDSNGLRLTTWEDGNRSGVCTTAQYFAPVYLPQGAMITRLTLRARDTWGGEFGGEVLLKLRRARDFSYLELARIGTGGSAAPGDWAPYTTAVSNGLVDNTLYGYYLDIDMRKPLNGDVNSLWFYQAQIEYSVPQAA